MLVRAVTETWKSSLDHPPSIGRVYQPDLSGVDGKEGAFGWERPDVKDEAEAVVAAPVAELEAAPPQALDQVDEDPEIQVSRREDIVPKRRGASKDKPADDRIWTSHEFWKGIVIGAGVVLLVKTILAVQAPYGIDWYGF
jgi:hypothetical protein